MLLAGAPPAESAFSGRIAPARMPAASHAVWAVRSVVSRLPVPWQQAVTRALRSPDGSPSLTSELSALHANTPLLLLPEDAGVVELAPETDKALEALRSVALDEPARAAVALGQLEVALAPFSDIPIEVLSRARSALQEEHAATVGRSLDATAAALGRGPEPQTAAAPLVVPGADLPRAASLRRLDKSGPRMHAAAPTPPAGRPGAAKPRWPRRFLSGVTAASVILAAVYRVSIETAMKAAYTRLLESGHQLTLWQSIDLGRLNDMLTVPATASIAYLVAAAMNRGDVPRKRMERFVMALAVLNGLFWGLTDLLTGDWLDAAIFMGSIPLAFMLLKAAWWRPLGQRRVNNSTDWYLIALGATCAVVFGLLTAHVSLWSGVFVALALSAAAFARLYDKH